MCIHFDTQLQDLVDLHLDGRVMAELDKGLHFAKCLKLEVYTIVSKCAFQRIIAGSDRYNSRSFMELW